MSHDALCPSLGKGTLPVIDLCACRLIARVRKEYASAYLDPDGVRELINMLQAALARMETDT